jgi:hypothetical protein
VFERASRSPLNARELTGAWWKHKKSEKINTPPMSADESNSGLTKHQESPD